MPRAVIARAILVMSVVAVIGGTAAGQTRPSTKKPAAKTPEKTSPTPKPAPVAADLTMRTRLTSGAQMSENTTYVKGGRRRVEFPGVVSIEQCDPRRTLVLNPAAKTYFVISHADAGSTATAAPPTITGNVSPSEAALAQQKTPATSTGGTVTYTTTVKDTGERKQMFGREARHITTVMAKSASASACDRTPLNVEMDGWYIDLPAVGGCASAPATPPVTARANACVDKVEWRTSGDAVQGFPLAMKTTMRTGDGEAQQAMTSSMEVTAFEMTTLDEALFNVPPGYTEMKSNTQLLASFDGGSSGLSDAMVGSTADGTGAAAPKGAGAVRIGVLEPVDKSTHKLPTRELRQQLASDFRMAPYEALTLAGSSAADAQAEAARMECDYILYSEIADIKTSKPGKLGGMLKRVTREAGPARDAHEVKLAYTLYRVGTPGSSPEFSESTKTTSGGGFDLRSAVHLAMSAGSLYLRFSGLGLLNPMLMANLGAGLGPVAGRGMLDPRMSAMSSMSELLASRGMEAQGDSAVAAMAGVDRTATAEIRQTVDTALASAAKGTIEQLKKKNANGK